MWLFRKFDYFDVMRRTVYPAITSHFLINKIEFILKNGRPTPTGGQTTGNSQWI